MVGRSVADLSGSRYPSKRPKDLPNTRIFKGETYTFEDWEFGRGACQILQADGETMKFDGEITNYRVIPYEGVLVWTGEGGR